MLRERDEIEEVLYHARELMKERPEIFSVDKEELLSYLDDGSREMRSWRWGVLAYVYVEELQKAGCLALGKRTAEMPEEEKSVCALVSALKEIKHAGFLHENMGYILQKEYDINLVELLLKAAEMGAYDKIIFYVKPNLVFEKVFVPERLEAFVDVYEANEEEGKYITVLYYYAKLLVRFNGMEYLMQKVIASQDTKYYRLMLFVRNELYEKDAAQADTVLLRFLQEHTELCNRLAIEFLAWSVRNGKDVFEQYFARWEELAEAEEQYWYMLIPTYMDYLQKYATEECQVADEVYKRLSMIARGNTQERATFILEFQYERNPIERLEGLLQEVLQVGFEKRADVLNSLGTYLYRKLEQGEVQLVLKLMQLIFSANGYGLDYDEFFEGISAVHGGLHGRQKMVMEQVIEKVIYGDERELYFAIGMFEEYVETRKIAKHLTENRYTGEELALVLQGLLYHMVESKRICGTAFQLVQLVAGDEDVFMKVCKNEIFANYPYTMQELAKQYVNDENIQAQRLGLEIEEAFRKYQENVDCGWAIKDLRPSAKRSEIYQRILFEQKKKINQMSEERSVFGRFMGKAVMKYGKRNAYVQVTGKDSWEYQVNPYAQVSFQVEPPRMFGRDILLLGEKRREFLERRKAYALNHKRVSCDA